MRLCSASTDYVEISGLRRVDPSTVPQYDWIEATVRLSVGPFRAEYGASFLRTELASLLEQTRRLYETLAGVAVLAPIEHALALRLTVDNRGHVLVSGETRHDLTASTSLRFEFEQDQTYLGAAIEELARDLSALPALG